MDYTIKIKFSTDRPLTEDERDVLCMTLFVMVDEPCDAEGEHAEWTCAADPVTHRSSAEISLREADEVLIG